MGKLTVLLIGPGGAGLVLLVFDLAWRSRFRGVRKQLVLRVKYPYVSGALPKGRFFGYGGL